MSKHVIKRLLSQLADLSVRAESVKEALNAAEKEAYEKIAARKQQAHAAATKAVEKVRSLTRIAKKLITRLGRIS